MVQVFDQNAGARRGRDVRCFVTIVATRSSVTSREREACLAMVQCLSVRLPMNQRKVGSIVVRMAAHAVFAGRILRQPNGMHPAPLSDLLVNLCVTIQTLELARSPSEFMALRAT